MLSAAGMAAILWDVETFDWQNPPDDVAIARAVEPAEPRIDRAPARHPARHRRTSGATIDGLRDRGFALVTVEQLFGDAAADVRRLASRSVSCGNEKRDAAAAASRLSERASAGEQRLDGAAGEVDQEARPRRSTAAG